MQTKHAVFSTNKEQNEAQTFFPLLAPVAFCALSFDWILAICQYAVIGHM